jgi:hypothetical protein
MSGLHYMAAAAKPHERWTRMAWECEFAEYWADLVDADACSSHMVLLEVLASEEQGRAAAASFHMEHGWSAQVVR